MIGINSGYYSPFSFPKFYGDQTNKNIIPELIESSLDFGNIEHRMYIDSLFTSACAGGDVSGKYDDSSTDSDPVMLVWGQDSKGNKFERKIHLNNINPKNASVVEMKALEAHLNAQGQSLGAGAALAFVGGNMDITEKIDFTKYFSDYNAMLVAGHHKPNMNLLLFEQYLFSLRVKNED